MDSTLAKIRSDFPILSIQANGHPLVYLDNAATTQKPRSVMAAVEEYYTHENSNVHRGVHYLSELATKKYEQTRDTVQKFINARSRREIIFTRGTTEAINLMAQTYGRRLKKGDEILISHMEHHSNIVPWQILCEQTGATLKVVAINEAGEIDQESFEELLTEKTKIFSIVYVSNSLGTINPVKEMIRKAKAKGAVTLVDGAQAIQHLPVDVQDLDCDFFAFSGHKIYGPTGIGVLYGKEKLLSDLPPYQGGGDMILSVSFDKTIYNELPYKFEAGTPNIEGVIGLGPAIEYVQNLGFKFIGSQEGKLLQMATERLAQIKGLRFIGTAKEKSSVISFVLNEVHPHDVGTILDQEGIAVRAGHHCTQPVMERYKVPATVRASFAFYNTIEEVDTLVGGLKKAVEIFK